MTRKQRCCTNCSAWFVPACHERTCSDACRQAKRCERGGTSRSGMEAMYAEAGIEADGHHEPTADQEVRLGEYIRSECARIRANWSKAELRKACMQPAVQWELPQVDERSAACRSYRVFETE